MMKTSKVWALLSVLLLGGCLLLSSCFLTGCGTVRGVLTGIEATGAGLIQDMRGAGDGIDRADETE